MIPAIIIGLTLLLVALLVDWRKVFKKLPKTSIRKRAPERVVSAEVSARMRAAHLPEPTPTGETVQQLDGLEDIEMVPVHKTSKEVEELLNQADIHFRKGELKAAEDIYLKAAAADPRCSKAYSRLGVIYLENGEEWDDAEAAFRQALKTDPNNGFVLNNLGLVLYHQDRYADAIRHFELAVRLDEQNAARHANLGMAYMAMRQYAKAESGFKRALKLSPNEMEYKDLLAEAVEKKIAHKSMIRH